MSKTIRVANAVEAIPEGSTLMIGGFIGVGSPVRLIDELVRQGKTGLTIIANDTSSSPWSMRASNFASEFRLSWIARGHGNTITAKIPNTIGRLRNA